MKKTALAVAILVTAALAGCHHNKPANNGDTMGSASGSAMGSSAPAGGDMGSSAPAGGSGAM